MNIPSAARKLASQTNGRLSKGPLTAETKAQIQGELPQARHDRRRRRLAR